MFWRLGPLPVLNRERRALHLIIGRPGERLASSAHPKRLGSLGLYSISRLRKIDGFAVGHRLLGGLDGLEPARKVEVDLVLDDFLDDDRHPVDAPHVDQGPCALVQAIIRF